MDGDDNDNYTGRLEETLSENLDRRLRVTNPRTDHGPSQMQQMVPPTPTNTIGAQSTMPQTTHNGIIDGTLFSKLEKTTKRGEDESENSCNNDGDFDEFDDDDQALEAFRQRRLAELKKEHVKDDQNMAKGHGEVRTITQDEFLPECNGSSKYVVVHFFHNDFERCKIMDHHLNIIAPLHLSCKFVRINAEKAPFFVAKLAIKTLPTVLVFKDGKTNDRLMGFEGLSDTKNPDQFATSRLGRWLESTGAIEYEGPDTDDEEVSPSTRTQSGMLASQFQPYDEDF